MVTIAELRSKIESKDIQITPRAMKREGTEDVEDFIREVAREYLEQQMGSTNYFPVRLDPKLHNISVVYGVSPLLTFLESRGRRTTSDTTKIDYLRYTTGFTNEWLGETDNTSGTGEAATGTASVTMKLSALPISMVDLIGMKASSRARSQLLDYAQIAVREDTDDKLINGTGSNNQFSGLDVLLEASGLRKNKGGAGNPITLKDVRDMETELWETRKSRPDFIVAPSTVVNYLADEMSQNAAYTAGGRQPLDIVPGINVPAFNSLTGPIPIIQDPFMPNTDNLRRLDMANTTHLFIEDFMSTAYIAEGRSKPFASSGWLGQILIFYDVAPELGHQAYAID